MTPGFRQRFNVDPRAFDLATSERNKQIIYLILGIAALICALVLTGTQNYHSVPAVLYILSIICAFVGFLEIITAPIAFLMLNAKFNKLRHSHIIVYDDKVTGIAYNAGSCPFELSYTDVIFAEALPTTPTKIGNNIKIVTASGHYLCYAIEQNAVAVNLINAKKAAFDAAAHASAASQNVSRYCIFCGTALPAASVFCCNCGKRQNI